MREWLRSKEKDGWSLNARVKNKNAFFFCIVPPYLNWFDLVGVFLVSSF